MTIRNLEEANQAWVQFLLPEAGSTDQGISLARMKPLMKLLGNPHEKLRVVHVAGTSGKTSTAYFMAALLQAGGKKVGLTVSPHIDSVIERAQIDGRPLDEVVFCKELEAFLEIIRGAPHLPPYSALLSAFALWVFVRQGVDYAVVETGTGGLHDGTNILHRADKVCLITDIGFDHMRVLGDTLAAIATHKIGIAHPGNHVFMYEQNQEIMNVVEQWTARHEALLHCLDETAERQTYRHDLVTAIDYQRRNWLLAYSVYRYLEQRDNLPHLTRQVLQQTQQLQVPARMDVRVVDDKTVIMDGGTNAQKLSGFIRSFRQLYPGVKPAFLLAFNDKKDYRTFVPLLAPLANRIIVTSLEVTQDLQIPSADPEMVAEAFRKGGITQVESIADQRLAFQALLAVPEEVCVITGSFYLISQIRNNERIT